MSIPKLKNALLLKNAIHCLSPQKVIFFAVLPSHQSHNKYNDNEKVWNVRITRLWHRDIKWADTIGKNGTHRLAQCKVVSTFSLFKKKKKCNYLWSVMKQSEIKWSTPVLHSLLELTWGRVRTPVSLTPKLLPFLKACSHGQCQMRRGWRARTGSPPLLLRVLWSRSWWVRF